MKATTVNISFSDSLLLDIDRVAKREKRSRSELLREAARVYIERKRQWERIFARGEASAERSKLSPGDIAKEIGAYRQEKRSKK